MSSIAALSTSWKDGIYFPVIEAGPPDAAALALSIALRASRWQACISVAVVTEEFHRRIPLRVSAIPFLDLSVGEGHPP